MKADVVIKTVQLRFEDSFLLVEKNMARITARVTNVTVVIIHESKDIVHVKVVQLVSGDGALTYKQCLL